MTEQPDLEAVLSACEILRERVDGESCYVLRSGDPHFVRLGCDDDPTTYEIKQKGYWLIRQGLAADPAMAAAFARVEERLVIASGALRAAEPCSHVAAILPADESSSELLVVSGNWPAGLSEDQVDFFLAARLVVSHLVAGFLDNERWSRQRAQMSALAEVATAFTAATEMDRVLSSIATAAARAADFDWVTIVVYDENESVLEKGRNLARHSSLREAMTRAQPLPGEHDEASEEVRQQLRAKQPVLRPDVFASDTGLSQEQRDLYARSHIISAAFFPLIFQDRLIGSIKFSSSTRRNFYAAETEYLAALASQVATSVMGLRLFRDLESSREELREYAARLEQVSEAEHFLARTDALTGIPNRRYAEEVLRAERARMERYGQPVSVVIADIDNFKRINDSFGHQSGDEVLKQFASLARESSRVNDFVARWGGDEFVIILPQTSHREAEAFAERFRISIERAEFSCRDGAPTERITISAGVAQAEIDPEDTADRLLDRADRALYEAKERGRNSVVCASIRTAAA